MREEKARIKSEKERVASERGHKLRFHLKEAAKEIAGVKGRARRAKNR